jgi:hypothetical protein
LIGWYDPMSEEKLVEIQAQVTGSDLERLVVVGGDLEYLQTLPNDRLLTHAEIRLAAGVLRRLLVDGELPAVWRIIGAHEVTKLVVSATEIDTALAAWPIGWIQYAWAGGASVSGAHHTGVVFGVVPKEEHERYGSVDEFFRSNPLPTQGGVRKMVLDDWLRSTSVAIKTNEIGLVKICRRAVLTYIANRRGGVHFDSRRNVKNLNSRKRRRENESALLDHGLLRVGHLSGPEFEVQSMVQVLAASDHAQELVRIAHSAAPEDFYGDPNELKLWTGVQQADGTGWATWRLEPAAEQEASSQR